MTHFPRMAEHHSGFDQSTLPSIPSDWVDTSWVNDGCPSFEVPGKPVRVWIDYPDPQHREFPEDGRFMVTAQKNLTGPSFLCLHGPVDQCNIYSCRRRTYCPSHGTNPERKLHHV